MARGPRAQEEYYYYCCCCCYYYYRPESLRRQQAFLDHFLKDTDDEVETWPPVRIEVRERYYEGIERAEREWPLTRTSYRRYALDAANGSLDPEPPATEASVDYDPDAEDGRAVFDLRFATRTEITGYAKLRLWVETDDGDDMDLFVALQKLDRAGRRPNRTPTAGRRRSSRWRPPATCGRTRPGSAG